MKLKSKYSLIGIIVAAVAVLVMFLPCLNGVSIMQYVWEPTTYETEYFKAPLTKGVVRYNGSLKTIDSLVKVNKVKGSDEVEVVEKVEGAAEYLEAYNEYMTELASKEAEFKKVKAEYEKTAADCETAKKFLDAKISRYNRPVEEAGRVLGNMNTAVEDNGKKLDAAIADIVKSYKVIDAGAAAKADAVSVAKALAATYSSTEEMKEKSAEAGAKVASIEKENVALDDANIAAKNEITENLANINRIENEFADIKTLAVYLYSRSSKEVPSAEEVAEFDREYVKDGVVEFTNEDGTTGKYEIPAMDDAVFVVEKDEADILTRITEGKEAVAEYKADNIAESLRAVINPNLIADDDSLIEGDIETLKALHVAKNEELVKLAKRNVELNAVIASNNEKIAANESVIEEVKASKDYVSYAVVALLNVIASDKNEAENTIAGAQGTIRELLKFDTVGTYEAVSAESVIGAKDEAFVAELKSASEAAVEGKKVVENIDFANLDVTDPVLKSVNEIATRSFFDSYYNNEQLVGDDKAESTYAESCAAIAKVLYLSPADKVALYTYFESEVTKVRDSNTEYAELKNKRADNDELTISNKAKYDEALSEMNSFIEDFENERISSTLFATATEYKDLLVQLYEDKATIKADKAEVKVVKKELAALKKNISKTLDVPYYDIDSVIEAAEEEAEEVETEATEAAELEGEPEEVEKAVAENIETYQKEYSVCDKFGTELKFYENKINTKLTKETDLSSYVTMVTSYVSNAANLEMLEDEIEELKEDVNTTKEAIKTLKAEKGLVEMQLTGTDYKTMVNDDEAQISWYNYYINNEVRFFIYIMILFVIVVLFALLVKFWQMDFIASLLMTIALGAAALCSDVLFVGNPVIWVIFILLTIANAYVTVMTLLHGMENGNK